jgi:hypothetical protein
MVPANWLSRTTQGQLVDSPIDPNAMLLPINAPLPVASKWTVADVKALVFSLSPIFPWRLVALNVSSTYIPTSSSPVGTPLGNIES